MIRHISPGTVTSTTLRLRCFAVLIRHKHLTASTTPLTVTTAPAADAYFVTGPGLPAHRVVLSEYMRLPVTLTRYVAPFRAIRSGGCCYIWDAQMSMVADAHDMMETGTPEYRTRGYGTIPNSPEGMEVYAAIDAELTALWESLPEKSGESFAAELNRIAGVIAT